MNQPKATITQAWPYQQDKMNLPVNDLDTALPFYKTMLGFQLIARNNTPHKSATLARDGIQIGLAENGGDPTQDGCFFAVDDVVNAHAELKANGLTKELSNFSFQKHGETNWKVFFVVATRRPLLLLRRAATLTVSLPVLSIDRVVRNVPA